MLQQDYLDEIAEQAELKSWIAAEYEAGHAARISGHARSKDQTVCWRMGWHDADVSLTLDAGDQDSGQITGGHILGWSLYALGQLARRKGLPFAEDSSEVWKRGWIQMDIHLGVPGTRGASEPILVAVPVQFVPSNCVSPR